MNGAVVAVSKLDGVTFDAELVHEYPRRGRAARVYAQVHNRGPLPVTRVAVRLFYANATGGLPAVPDGFFTGFRSWDTQAGEWTAVGPTQTIDTLAPGTPDVRRFDWTVPTNAATHTCMLMLITSDDDPITATGTSVDAAVPTSRHLALLNLHVVDYGELGKPGDDDPAAITDDNAPVPSATQLQLHNNTPVDHEYTLRITWAGSGPLTVALALPAHPTDTVDIDHGSRQPLPKQVLAANREPLKGLDDPTRTGSPGTGSIKRWILGAAPEMTVKGLLIPAHRSLPIAVLAAPAPGAEIGQEQRVDVVQLLDATIVGGSTLAVRSGAERHAQPILKHVRATLTARAAAIPPARTAEPTQWTLAIGLRRRPRLITGTWPRTTKPITVYDGTIGLEDWLEFRAGPTPRTPLRPRPTAGRLILPPPVWDHPGSHRIGGPEWSAQLDLQVTNP